MLGRRDRSGVVTSSSSASAIAAANIRLRGSNLGVGGTGLLSAWRGEHRRECKGQQAGSGTVLRSLQAAAWQRPTQQHHKFLGRQLRSDGVREHSIAAWRCADYGRCQPHSGTCMGGWAGRRVVVRACRGDLNVAAAADARDNTAVYGVLASEQAQSCRRTSVGEAMHSERGAGGRQPAALHPVQHRCVSWPWYRTYSVQPTEHRDGGQAPGCRETERRSDGAAAAVSSRGSRAVGSSGVDREWMVQ